MPAQRRKGPYKKYLRDSIAELPRTTRWLRQRQEREVKENGPVIEQAEEFIPVLDVLERDCIAPEDETSDTDISSMSVVDENEMPQERTPSKDVTDSDSTDSEESASDASSTISAADMDDGLQTNDPLEDSEGENPVNEDGQASDNEDLHFGERGNLLNPNIFGWKDIHNHENRPTDRQPLYEGSRISQQESDILILSFIIRWGLEEKGIEHLLRLIDCHMPTALLGSRYLFLKKFEAQPSMKVRYFCRICSEMLPTEDEREQITRILSNRDLVRQLRKECAESDVISGKVYKHLRARGVIRDDDLSLQWNTDGVKPFKSSKVTVYPIQACINELPPLARKDNMVLCGLYYGTTKPDMNVILKPFVDELETLHSVGINCNIAGSGERLVKVHTLVCSVDSVARAMLQGIMQFNGKYGCSFCLREGTRVERGRGFARVYIGGHLDLPRSTEQHLDAFKSLENYNRTHNIPKTHVEGVKKGSILILLPVFSIINSFVPDYMHAALEGVVVTFWKHWCSSEYEGKLWHLTRAKRRLLNEKLEAILPPVEVTRAPRSLDDIALWKAS